MFFLPSPSAFDGEGLGVRPPLSHRQRNQIMKQQRRRTLKPRKPLPAGEQAAQESRAAGVRRFQLTLGYIIVGLAVIAGFVQSFWPQVFGLRETNPAVGFGLAALAAFRLYALRR